MNLRVCLCPRFPFRIRYSVAALLAVMMALAWTNRAFCGEIHDAARIGDLKKVRKLLKHNPDLVFSKDSDGETPLQLAAVNNRKDVVELLLANGAAVGAKDNKGWAPLHFAAEFGYREVVELLLSSKADVNAGTNDGITPLHLAARIGRKDIVGLLLANGAAVNAKDITAGDTPLHWAAIYCNKDAAELLLANKTEVNASNRGGLTPLHMAARWEHQAALAAYASRMMHHSRVNVYPEIDTDMVTLLLANGAEINAKDTKGWTPLHYAQSQGITDVAELLRQHGGHE